MRPLEGDEEVKLVPEKTITKRIKFKKIAGAELKILTPNINQTASSISTDKSWKQLIQIKKRNQTYTISFVSAQ